MPLALATVIAAITMPAVRWLERHKVPHTVAIVLGLLLDLAILGATVSLLVGSLSSFYDAMPRYETRLSQMIQENLAWLNSHGLHLSNDARAKLMETSGVVSLIGSLLSAVMNALGSSFLVSLLVVFMLLEASRWRLKLRYAMGNPEADLRRIAAAARELQKYLLVKSALNTLTGVLCGGWVAVMGVDFPILWAFVAFVLNYIPTVGSIIAGVPPVLLAWVQLGPGPALVVLLGYGVINAILGSTVEPRLMGKALGLSPLVVLVSMVFWWWMWGPIGALLSAPLTMAVKVAFSRTSDMRWLSIVLGSAKWVEEMHAEWALARPTTVSQPDICCSSSEGKSGGALNTGSTSRHKISTFPPPLRDSEPPESR